MLSHFDLEFLPLEDPQESQLPSPTAPGSGVSAPAQGTEAGTTADGSPAGEQPTAAPGGLGGMLVPFGILLLFMWFFVMRPERKRQKERAGLLAAIKKGDHVVTIGGLHGQVTRLEEQTVTIKVSDDQRLKFDRSAISRIASAKDDAAAAVQQAELAAASN